MVKSYDRYEQTASIGVIASSSNVIWLLPLHSSKSIGKALTAALEDIIVWDIKTGEITNRLKDGLTPGAHNAPTSLAPATVTVLAYHSESNIVASGYSDGLIKVWDLASASVVMTFQGHKSGVTQLKFDKTGARLVSGSYDSSIILWDLVGEEGLFKLKGHKGQITGIQLLSLHDDEDQISDAMEDYLMSVSKDGLIKLWDLKSQQCIETHVAHSSECWSLGTDMDRGLVFTAGSRDDIKVWRLDLGEPDTKKIEEVGTFAKQSKSRTSDIQFQDVAIADTAATILYLQNADRTIEIFRIRLDDEIKRGIARRTKRLAEKGLEGDEIAQSIQEAQVSMLVVPYAVVRASAKIRSCCWVPKSSKKMGLLLSLTNNSIEYYALPQPALIKKATPADILPARLNVIEQLGHRSDIRAMDISPDDKLVVTASNGELKIWNIKTHSVVRSFALDSGYALCCKFLPGGTLVVVGFKNGALELWDLTSSSLVDRVDSAHGKDEGSAVWTLDLTPDGQQLITGGNDKAVKFWNFNVEREIVPGTNNTVLRMRFVHNKTIEVNEDVLCVKVSPDARLLAVSLLNNNVQVIFMDTSKLFLTLYGHKLPVLSMDISQDSKLIITSSADKNIKIWGLDFGDCHKSIFGHQDSIMNVKFLGDSHNFFSAAKDGVVKHWDGDKFECIQKLAAHQSEVWCLCVSSDGLFVCSTSHDHSIRIWAAGDDQVFLEEEREKEMDELYEEDLLEGDDQEKPEQDGDEVATGVQKQTMETLKAGEKLMEALDIGYEDICNREDYEADLKRYKTQKTGGVPARPTTHTVLMATGVSGEEYVMNVASKIRLAHMEDALLVFPFSYTLKLLKLIEVWTSSSKLGGNIVHLSLICKMLFFVVKSNSRELIGQQDPKLKNQLLNVKEQLRSALQASADEVGFNTQGLKYAKKQWQLEHETEFIDEEEQRKAREQRAVKRSYTTI